MSEFGDFDPDDAFDTEPADPEQVARKLHGYRQEDEPGLPDWDDLSNIDKAILVNRLSRLLAWLRRQGAA